MTPVDDLKIGQWIAVCSERDGNTFCETPSKTGNSFSGEPVKILAISLPFLCVWLPQQKCVDTIDVRRQGVVKLNKTYVFKMSLPRVDFRGLVIENKSCNKSCPACGDMLLQEMAATNETELHYYCQACGFTGSV